MALAALVAAAPAAAADPCPQGMRCLSVEVPLDRSGAVPGKLELPVAVEEGEGPVLVALGGGPGQGMVANAAGFAAFLGPLSRHRVAVLDQRGTGATALECPAMQRAALTDFTVPPPRSVRKCGRSLGELRELFTTTDTVADLEAVRAALGAERIAILGISYGTYVAERYARAHPDRVSRLVLDSVVPQQNVDPFFVANMGRAERILRALCRRGGSCARATDDPVRDLRRLVRRTNREPLRGKVRSVSGAARRVRIDGPALFDLVASLSSFVQNRFPVLPGAVKRALRDRPGRLFRLAAKTREINDEPDASVLSWGLHSATACADVSFPWGSPATRPKQRRAAVVAAAKEIPRHRLGPFDRATVAGNGLMVTCEKWPAASVAPPPEPGRLPAVPTLILAGTWDLSTPIEDARIEASRSPTTQLVVLRQMGHSTVTSHRCVGVVVERFFADQALGRPCKSYRAPIRPSG